MHWPHGDERDPEGRQAWIDKIVVPDGLRPPTELRAMPTQGKVVLAASARWQAAAFLAAREGLDYFLNDLVPSDQVFVMDWSESA